MKASKSLGGGNCARRLLRETALLPPPIRRGRWGRPDVTGRPCCRQGASLSWRGDGAASFITRIGVFLTVAHLVPKCLLVACKLLPKRGVSSEPCAELVPTVFCVEALAILVIRAIFHFWTEGISITVVVTEESAGNFGQRIAGRQQIPPCAGHGNP